MSWLEMFRNGSKEEREHEKLIKRKLKTAAKAYGFNLILYIQVAEGIGFYAVYKLDGKDEQGPFVTVEKVNGVKKVYYHEIYDLRPVDPIEIIKKKYGANLGKSQPRGFCNEIYCN